MEDFVEENNNEENELEALEAADDDIISQNGFSRESEAEGAEQESPSPWLIHLWHDCRSMLLKLFNDITLFFFILVRVLACSLSDLFLGHGLGMAWVLFSKPLTIV